MASKKFGDYYLGLDLGTDSVGWAITDLEYNIEQLNGKGLWGVRCFDEAVPAETRRLYRTQRRRLQRRNQRLQLLQELLADEISKIDPDFFMRLKESKYHLEDKSTGQKNLLFCDKNYSDKEYHKEYPTIYHLRKKLIESDEKMDLRLIYLGIHHILKFRGHFLFEKSDISEIRTVRPLLTAMQQEWLDAYGMNIQFDFKELEDLLKDHTKGAMTKTSEIKKILTIDGEGVTDKQANTLIQALSGRSIKLNEMFPELDWEETEIKTINFSDDSIDENMEKVEEALLEKLYLLETLKGIYDWSILSEMLGDETLLSNAKVKIYEKHHQDLVMLKSVMKRYLRSKYKEMFSKSDEKDNYCTYVGVYKHNGKKGFVQNKKCNQIEFNKHVLEILKDIDVEDDRLIYIREHANSAISDFMPKIVSKDNGVIPYQLHYIELKKFLRMLADTFRF